MSRRTEPAGHTHRISRATDSPDLPLLRSCDVAWLLGVSVPTVHNRDALIRPIVVPGPGGRMSRSYTLADIRKFLEACHVGQALKLTEPATH